MSVLFAALGILILVFGLVVLRGAPYLPTLRKQADIALDMLGLSPGEVLLELGCGDGRIARMAAEQGVKVVGYELNPILVLVSRMRTWKYRSSVKIVWGDYWSKDWPQADGIFVFLLDHYMEKLDKKIIQQYSQHDIKLVSIAFKIPRRSPIKTWHGVFLYEYK